MPTSQMPPLHATTQGCPEAEGAVLSQDKSICSFFSLVKKLSSFPPFCIFVPVHTSMSLLLSFFIYLFFSFLFFSFQFSLLFFQFLFLLDFYFQFFLFCLLLSVFFLPFLPFTFYFLLFTFYFFLF